MMILLENPWPILLVGVAVEAILAVILFCTGRGRILWIMLGTGVLVLAGVAIEYLVVTEREAIRNMLDRGTAAVWAGDLDGVLACISPSARQARIDSRSIIETFEFPEARISNVQSTVNRAVDPRTAKAEFLAIGEVRNRKTGDYYGKFICVVKLDLRKEDGRWRGIAYTVEEYKGPKKNRDNTPD